MAGPFVIADNMTRQVPLKENSFGVLAEESLERITRDDFLKSLLGKRVSSPNHDR
jgi:hypothetical protein